MWTDLWPLGFMLGLFALLYLISLALHALGINPTLNWRPDLPPAAPENGEKNE